MTRRFARLRNIFLTVAAAGLVPALLSSQALAVPTRGVCSPSKVAFVASNALTSNSTANFVTVAESTVNFSQGGTKASCVIVHLWANTSGNSTGFYVRVTLDGVSAALPDSPEIARWGDVFLHGDEATFVIASVTPGAHKIQLQLRSSGGTQVRIGPYNLFVSYAP